APVLHGKQVGELPRQLRSREQIAQVGEREDVLERRLAAERSQAFAPRRPRRRERLDAPPPRAACQAVLDGRDERGGGTGERGLRLAPPLRLARGRDGEPGPVM